MKPIATMFELKAGRTGVERRELIGVVADHRDPLGLQELERFPNVEDRFGAGANDGDAGARQLDQIGRDVERLLAPRCTPPMPPVAKISMPASPAMNIVAATVVPAEPLRAATSARSRREL